MAIGNKSFPQSDTPASRPHILLYIIYFFLRNTSREQKNLEILEEWKAVTERASERSYASARTASAVEMRQGTICRSAGAKLPLFRKTSRRTKNVFHRQKSEIRFTRGASYRSLIKARAALSHSEMSHSLIFRTGY